MKSRFDTPAFQRKMFPHLQRMKVKLADGSTANYMYHRLARRRIYSTYGTPAFEAEYEAARRGLPGPARQPSGIYIYFVRAEGTGRIKIGKAKSPATRLKDLQIGCPDELCIAGLLFDPSGGTLEPALHAKFARHRIRGEWFAGDPEIVAWLEEHAHRTPIAARRAALGVDKKLEA